MAIERPRAIRAFKVDLPQINVLLGDELFIQYIHFVYPQYDLYEYICIDGIARIHRYFLYRKQHKENKPKTFDALITPLWTLEELRNEIHGK